MQSLPNNLLATTIHKQLAEQVTAIAPKCHAQAQHLL